MLRPTSLWLWRKRYDLCELLLGFLAAWGLLRIADYIGNHQHTNTYNPEEYQTIYSIVFLATVHVSAVSWDFITRHHDAIFGGISTLATAFLALFTGRLWRTTRNQERMSRAHERAYIMWGGLYGKERKGVNYAIEENKRDARKYAPPWTMQVHNFGRTPGFITEVRWGICESEAKFSALVGNSLLTPLIENGMIPTTSIKREIVVNPTTNDRPWPYRFVRLERRKPGTVLYGRIDYTDVFGQGHYSTWAGLVEKSVLTPIGEFMAKDWGQRP